MFERHDDAARVMAVLPKRFGKYGLRLHPEKTKLLEFRKPASGSGGQPPDSPPGSRTFDFLGFTHHGGTSRWGKGIIKRRTASKRRRRALERVKTWCREHRHDPLVHQQKMLSSKLKGHFGYYGITGNSSMLGKFRGHVIFVWYKALARRSQRGMTWETMQKVLTRYVLPPTRIVHS